MTKSNLEKEIDTSNKLEPTVAIWYGVVKPVVTGQQRDQIFNSIYARQLSKLC